jgi:hypothetical protein
MIIKAPIQYVSTTPSVFLAGSIEQGKAENWQEKLSQELDSPDVTIFNPRREDWDASWEQSINNPQFKGQVDWELDNLAFSDIRLFYFQPNTLSPITLMELGIVAGTDDLDRETYVFCPQGFWRKGNVDIVCQRFSIPQVHTFDELALVAKQRLQCKIQESRKK